MHDGYFGDEEAGMIQPSRREVVQKLTRSDAYVLVANTDDPPEVPTGKFKDDTTGQILLDSLVREAQALELDYFEAKKVWEIRPRSECMHITGKKPISVRWVLVNKGDDDAPFYRARLVARQIRHQGVESVFAPTPPLEGIRSVLSLAATKLPGDSDLNLDPESEERMQIAFLDISRAYFNAPTDPSQPTYVELPPEHPQGGQMVGLLRRHMYGTLRAADGWQEEYSCALIQMGFRQGLSSPCLFYHPTKHLMCAVHGDDFTVRGAKRHLDDFERDLRGRYELKSGGRLGPGPKDDKEAVVLNRVVTWGSEGITIEADPRQVEKVLLELGLDGETKGAATPGLKVTKTQLDSDEPLEQDKHTLFRGVSARCNYVAHDRPDVTFAAKEVCRSMASPTSLSLIALKRLGRYLTDRKRLVYSYPFQEADGIHVYSDTDWAGCPKTRRSTSGGAVMLGSHCLKVWSSTQPTVSLSSGEAEFYGLVKASGVGLGFSALLADFGRELPVTVWTDSSAAMGVVGRQGLGRLRHLDTHSLWVQQAVRSHRITVRKVRGDDNVADLFTKHLTSRDRISYLLGLLGCVYQDGRAQCAPALRRDRQTRVTLDEAMKDAENHHEEHNVKKAFDVEDEELQNIVDTIGDAPYTPDGFLPHQVAGAEDLYPALRAQETDEVMDLPDYVDKEIDDDFLERIGYRIAQQISRDARENGCRRYPKALHGDISESRGDSA